VLVDWGLDCLLPLLGHGELLHVLGRELNLLQSCPDQLVIIVEDGILEAEGELARLSFLLQHLRTAVADPLVEGRRDFFHQICHKAQLLRRQIVELAEGALEEEVEDVAVDGAVLAGIDMGE
jgi:hypothetical protein